MFLINNSWSDASKQYNVLLILDEKVLHNSGAANDVYSGKQLLRTALRNAAINYYNI